MKTRPEKKSIARWRVFDLASHRELATVFNQIVSVPIFLQLQCSFIIYKLFCICIMHKWSPSLPLVYLRVIYLKEVWRDIPLVYLVDNNFCNQLTHDCSESSINRCPLHTYSIKIVVVRVYFMYRQYHERARNTDLFMFDSNFETRRII
jgi:hypothetical protein